MRRIFKYPLPIVDSQRITLPRGAKVLTVGQQDDHTYLWAEVDPEAPPQERVFFVYGTGNPMPDGPFNVEERYIGTIFQAPFVWHVYEPEQRKPKQTEPQFDTRYLTGP